MTDKGAIKNPGGNADRGLSTGRQCAVAFLQISVRQSNHEISLVAEKKRRVDEPVGDFTLTCFRGYAVLQTVTGHDGARPLVDNARQYSLMY
jgi:hypothetical protein